MTTPHERAFEVADLLHAVGDDDELAQLVAAQFLALGDSLPQQLGAALAAGDTTAATRLAHQIKGMATMLGAWRLAAAARAVEEGDASTAASLRLHEQWQRVAHCLGRYVAPDA